jgi:hypothetical protein
MSGNFIKPANPAFVVSTNNLRLVPNRKKAEPKEVQAFVSDLKKEKGIKEEKPKKEEK